MSYRSFVRPVLLLLEVDDEEELFFDTILFVDMITHHKQERHRKCVRVVPVMAGLFVGEERKSLGYTAGRVFPQAQFSIRHTALHEKEYIKRGFVQIPTKLAIIIC